MRIVHILWALSTGGAENMLIDIINVQVETEIVGLAIINDVVETNLMRQLDTRCQVRLFHRKKGSRSLMPWIALNAYLLFFKPDIIHFHLEGMRRMVLVPATKVFTIHNIHTSGKEYSGYKALYAISDGVKKYTKDQGYDAITVNNGIKTSIIASKKERIYVKGEICHIVCVGRLFIQHKGQDILVAALDVLKKKGIKEFHLDIIGDGESRKQLEDMIAVKELQSYVTLMGQKDRSFIYNHLSEYDLFVLPSRSEGFGLSVAEAMCAKVPVLVCDLEGVLDVIDGGRFGVFFKTGDIEDLANKIELFIKNGADIKQVENAYKYALTHFDIRDTAHKYIYEYKKLVNEKYK